MRSSLKRSVPSLATTTYWTNPQVPGANPATAQALLVAAVPASIAQQLSAGMEYYGFKLILSSVKTVGTGACTGCSTPVCITLSQLKVVASDNSAHVLADPARREHGDLAVGLSSARCSCRAKRHLGPGSEPNALTRGTHGQTSAGGQSCVEHIGTLCSSCWRRWRSRPPRSNFIGARVSTELTFTSATRCTLVIQADAGEGRLPTGVAAPLGR
jgi:hypothetical protein